MKRFLNIMIVLMAAVVTACHKEIDLENGPLQGNEQQVVDGSLVNVRFGVKIPDPISVATRAVDPDGNGIQTMTLFCFDGEGLLISTATATLNPNPNDKDNETGGILDADIPNTTRVIHLLANQNMAQFKEDDFRNLSEDQVVANLEGSSGMMIYWARVEVPSKVVGSGGILDWITVMTNPTSETHGAYQGEDNPIIMLRNQAKVMIDANPNNDSTDSGKIWDWEGNDFVVTGFTVVNTPAFGAVAPYHTSYGYPTYACKNNSNNTSLPADWVFTPEFGLTEGTTTNWVAENYVNLPRRSDKFSNITDVDTAPQTYVFETENSSADPVGVIIKGYNINNNVAGEELYYRVTLTDAQGEQVLVRRNHLYTINIAGNLLYGVDSFNEALDAPATNNVWLSISDEVKSVQNDAFRLTVERTSLVLDEKQVEGLTTQTTPASVNLGFTVEKLGTDAINASDLSVSWVDSNQDVSKTISFAVGSNVIFDTTTGVGSITLPLNNFTENEGKSILEGTLLVKYGHLQRKIKVVIVKVQEFTPTWVTAQVYNATGSSQANATMMFTIPEDCPAELFPMQVLISTNELDVRSETGQVLPIVRKGEEGYGEDNGIGYKYIYEVDGPGMQYVYMKSILEQISGQSSPITIEAEHFESVTKHVVYTEELFAITVTNVTSSDTATGDDADKIFYTYLPQKKNAPFAINLQLKNESVNPATTKIVGQFDEFLLYSQNLDAYEDNEVTTVKGLLPSDPWLSISGWFPCQFVEYAPAVWSSGGRVFAFMPRYQYYDVVVKNTTTSYEDFNNNFSVYMKTNKAKSAELIRISSNQLSQRAAFETTYALKDGVYVYDVNADESIYLQKGTVNTYRSMVFELRNYPAFRFAAQVNGQPDITAGEVDLTDAEESVTPVQIAYKPGTNVTVEFDVTSFTAADGTAVDPFGSEFDIYIQTPGLVAVDGQTLTKVDDTGLYKYTVDATRATAAADGAEQSLQSSVTGERKVFTFKTEEIVTEGDIVVYADQEAVTYKTKTFSVTNAPIAGTIQYTDGETTAGVPADNFVSFSRVLDGSRIGSLTVTSAGNYQLRLRKEYEFTWAQNDPVKLYAKIGDAYYEAEYANLAALYAAPNIVLTKEEAVTQ